MGLDMYLTKRTYIGANYKHRKVVATIAITKDGEPVNIDPKKVSSIEEHVGYWRKANHIHKWFVDNVQDGVDECQNSEVSKAQLKELLELCKKVKGAAKVVRGQIHTITRYENGVETKEFEEGDVIENPEEVAALMPTEGGFFFGSTEYNAYYLQDIDDTIKIIEALDLDDKSYEVEYFYQASW